MEGRSWKVFVYEGFDADAKTRLFALKYGERWMNNLPKSKYDLVFASTQSFPRRKDSHTSFRGLER